MSNNEALDMFVLGASPRQIANQLQLPEPMIEQQLLGSIKEAARARAKIETAGGPTVLAERIEALLRVMMPKALKGGDGAVEAAEMCRRLLNHSEASTPTSPESGVAAAVTKGDNHALAALRDRLARDIDAARSPRVVASLSRQFTAVIALMNEMTPPTTTRVDEIAERRAQRQAALRGTETAN